MYVCIAGKKDLNLQIQIHNCTKTKTKILN